MESYRVFSLWPGTFCEVHPRYSVQWQIVHSFSPRCSILLEGNPTLPLSVLFLVGIYLHLHCFKRLTHQYYCSGIPAFLNLKKKKPDVRMIYIMWHKGDICCTKLVSEQKCKKSCDHCHRVVLIPLWGRLGEFEHSPG